MSKPNAPDPQPITTEQWCRVAFWGAILIFTGLGIWARIWGFHERPTSIGAGLISLDIYVEIDAARILLSGDLREMHDRVYAEELEQYGGEGYRYAGVPLAALPVLPIVWICDALEVSETTLVAAAGLPFVFGAPIGAFAVWTAGGRARARDAPDVALVAIALLLSPLAFEVSALQARPYYLFPALDLAAILALRRSAVRSGVWMGLAFLVKPTSVATVMVLGVLMFVEAATQRQWRQLLAWGGAFAAVVLVGYGPFLAVNPKQVVENFGILTRALPITSQSIPGGVLSVLGEDQIGDPLHHWVQMHWSPTLIMVAFGIGLAGVSVVKRIPATGPATIALAAMVHALIVTFNKTVYLRYAAYPTVLAIAYALQPTTPNGIRWGLGLLIAQSFVLTAVPLEWKVPAWLCLNAILALVLGALVWKHISTDASGLKETPVTGTIS